MSIRLCPTSQESFVSMHSSVEYGLSPKHFSDKTSTSAKAPKIEVFANSPAECDEFWSALVDLLPEGVIVVAPNMKLVHLNLKAKELCQRLTHSNYKFDSLPSNLVEICQHLIRKSGVEDRLVVESETPGGLRLRIRARWFSSKPNLNETAGLVTGRFILLLLESYDEILREELRIERYRYDLTEREAEIWLLLRQEYSYQDIAKALRISLNTVKTHIKNVYAKRRNYQGQDRTLAI